MKKLYYVSLKMGFSIPMGFQNANENEFHGFGNLVIWLWKSFGKAMKKLWTYFSRSSYEPCVVMHSRPSSTWA